MSDEEYMRQALALAEKGRGITSPNPLVGAIVVKNEAVIGRGFHERAGGPHAEVVALEEAGDQARGATLYINLEPCSHFGRTPPCADLIIKKGIAEVVCSMEDPNPLVSGNGLRRLQEAGIQVRCGILRDEAKRINEVYLKYITTGFPFVILKLAQSLDGKIAAKTGDSKWITGHDSREFVHRLRSQVDAVLVGINTVLVDDPMLDVRLVEGRDPTKIVLDSRLRIPMEARALSKGRLIVATLKTAPGEKVEALRGRGADVWMVPSSDGRPDIKAVMAEAGKRGITSVLIEGGAQVATSALKAGIVDKLMLFIAPKIVGEGMSAVGDLGIRRICECLRLEEVQVERIGEDLLYVAKVRPRGVVR